MLQPTPVSIDFDHLCDLGLEASRRMDKDRLYIGHLALMVETHYSENTLAEFARRICVSKSSIYDYRSVARMFRDFPRCGKFLEKDAYPSLCFTHYRAASRLTTEAEIMAYLEQQAADMTTPDQVISGNDKGEYGLTKVAEFERYAEDAPTNYAFIRIPREVESNLDMSKPCIVKIYQLNEE